MPGDGAAAAWTPLSLGSNLLQNITSLAYSGSTLDGLPVIPSSVGTFAVPRGQRGGNFDGTDDYVASPVTLNGATEFTVWRRAKYTATSGWDLDGFFGATPIRLGRDNGTTNIWWDPGVSVGGSGISIADNVWHTLAMTSKSGGTATLYKNGTQIATASPGTFSISNALPFWIGVNNTNNSAISHPSAYVLSDYRVYNRELTSAEITWLETDGASGTDPGLTNCLFHYSFAEESGLTAYDTTGKGNHGTYTGITQLTFHATDAGITRNINNDNGYTLSGSIVIPRNEASPTLDCAGNALQYAGPIALPATMEVPCITGDGIDAKVDLGSQLIPNSGDFTIALAAYIPSSPTPWATILSQTDGALWATCFNLFFHSGTGWKLTYGSYLANSIVFTPIDNAWNTFAIRKVGTSLYLSLNGAAEVSTTCLASITPDQNTQLLFSVGGAYLTGRVANVNINGKVFPLQDGPGTSNTNRDVAWFNVATGGVIANAIVNGTVANIWANRTSVARDACIDNGGGIAANGAFVVGIPGSANDAAGNAKTLAVGTHGNPYSRFVPNYWNAPSLVQIGSDNTDKYAPTDTVQSESIADTRFRKAGFVKYFATRTALTGTDKTNAEAYAA